MEHQSQFIDCCTADWQADEDRNQLNNNLKIDFAAPKSGDRSKCVTQGEGDVVAHAEQLSEADETVLGVDAVLFHAEERNDSLGVSVDFVFRFVLHIKLFT